MVIALLLLLWLLHCALLLLLLLVVVVVLMTLPTHFFVVVSIVLQTGGQLRLTMLVHRSLVPRPTFSFVGSRTERNNFFFLSFPAPTKLKMA